MKIPFENLLSLLELADGSKGSNTFRALLAKGTTEDLTEVTREALLTKGTPSAYALQDCVNTVGNRLDFKAEFGRYRGTPKETGHDGLWKSETARDFVVEVKKSEAFAIDPQTLVDYMEQLASKGQINEEAIGLYVLGEVKVLDKTIKGAGLTEKVRVISVEALLHLLHLYERASLSHEQIVTLLSPLDSVRVDSLLGIIEEVLEKREVEEEEGGEESGDGGSDGAHAQTARKVIDAAYAAITATLETKLGKDIAAPGRKLRRWNNSRAVLFYSKDYESGGGRYWFAIHPKQVAFLETGASGFAIFVCEKTERTVVWPFADLKARLGTMNVTEEEKRMYWHVPIWFKGAGKTVECFTKGRGGTRIDLTEYLNAWDVRT